MNYHKYYPIDVLNGPGTRCTLFVAGCVHKCLGCYNATTWKIDSGKPYSDEITEQIIRDLKHTEIIRQGLSLSGGDPLHPANCEEILKLVLRVRQECPDKDIWAWTGYTMAELNDIQLEIVSHLDVLIDGRFEQSLADPSLTWRGSSNQVIHHLR